RASRRVRRAVRRPDAVRRRVHLRERRFACARLVNLAMLLRARPVALRYRRRWTPERSGCFPFHGLAAGSPRAATLLRGRYRAAALEAPPIPRLSPEVVR